MPIVVPSNKIVDKILSGLRMERIQHALAME